MYKEIDLPSFPCSLLPSPSSILPFRLLPRFPPLPLPLLLPFPWPSSTTKVVWSDFAAVLGDQNAKEIIAYFRF